jgi:hypothetical protein
MSGPKVVRIVTREEIEAICRQHITSAEEAAAELRRCAKRHDALSDALTADVEGRIRQLRRLFEEDGASEADSRYGNVSQDRDAACSCPRDRRRRGHSIERPAYCRCRQDDHLRDGSLGS